MKAVFILFALAVAVSAHPYNTKYTEKYDTVNLNEILSNRRLLVPYVKCLLDQGKCSPDGKELKSHIREALENNCANCSETQRHGTLRIIAHLMNHEPDSWLKLLVKYDREGKYITKYKDGLGTRN